MIMYEKFSESIAVSGGGVVARILCPVQNSIKTYRIRIVSGDVPPVRPIVVPQVDVLQQGEYDKDGVLVPNQG